MTIASARPEIPITINDLTWREFKVAEQLIDLPGIRLSCLDGVLEICRIPVEQPAMAKERMGIQLEIYLLRMDIDLHRSGS